jgi:ketosteroid isomerase-like protein
MTDDRELQALLDRDAIRDLIYRHSDAVNRQDFDAMAELYTADAVWESPLLEMRFEGISTFIEFLRSTSTGLEILYQEASNPVVDLLDADTAQASTSMHEMTRTGQEGFNLEQYGMYFDEFTRTDAGWRFRRRTFVTQLSAQDVVTGAVVTRQPISRPD